MNDKNLARLTAAIEKNTAALNRLNETVSGASNSLNDLTVCIESGYGEADDIDDSPPPDFRFKAPGSNH